MREEADGKGGKSRARREQRGETAGVESEAGRVERQVQECPEDMAHLLSVRQDDEHTQVVLGTGDRGEAPSSIA